MFNSSYMKSNKAKECKWELICLVQGDDEEEGYVSIGRILSDEDNGQNSTKDNSVTKITNFLKVTFFARVQRGIHSFYYACDDQAEKGQSVEHRSALDEFPSFYNSCQEWSKCNDGNNSVPSAYFKLGW